MTKRCKLIYRQARSPLRLYRQANFRQNPPMNPPTSRDQIKIHLKLKLSLQIKMSVVSSAHHDDASSFI